MQNDAKGAVLEALERFQSQPRAGGPLHAEHVLEAMHGGRRPALQNGNSERSARPRTTEDSLIKARYASTVLRVAQTADRETAARLVRGLANDFPHPDELLDVADIHLRAIDSFSELAASLTDAAFSKQQHLWQNALAAARDWLRAVSARQ
jgi:hypothetical protein